MSREDMLRVKKIQKLAVRDETKDLVDALDNMVPASPQVRRHRSLLRSGRSITQLLQDVQAEVQRRMQGAAQSDTFLSPSLLAQSFDCASCPVAVVSVPSLLLLSTSKGFRTYLDAFPDKALAGQSIIHLVEPSYQSSFQTFFGRVAAYPGEHFSSCVFLMLTRCHDTHLRLAPFIVEDCWCQEGTHLFIFLKPIHEATMTCQLTSSIPDTHVQGVYRFEQILSTFDPIRLERCLQGQVAGHMETFILRSLCDLWQNSSYDDVLQQVAEKNHLSLEKIKGWSTQIYIDAQVSDVVSQCTVRSRYSLPFHLGQLATDWTNEQSIVINELPAAGRDDSISSFWLIDQRNDPDDSKESVDFQEFFMRKLNQQLKCYCTRMYSISSSQLSIRGRTFQTVHSPGMEYTVVFLPAC
ncbi:hypothetical protein GUITHDRAFT_144611 [Guillardia theta CCMP2712]|uniref:Uncharacterized protein n=1 Tax=Guillardia theta (strain CCMP2712) TaxID=905079 RepID=L1INQ2_GUITC|nr:hypothetical protein GUITHDRAFT_144611 [Guillardia theta CCMP2712]EKX37916.1 hypothetical protein GUITHDRAFT_144611 [Guillardia theta CCMP2712]|eukprot:XP_005824896.1 hypothetical protein GUITHDRAFT_144611 [Guillardia theta CCMP2712]